MIQQNKIVDELIAILLAAGQTTKPQAEEGYHDTRIYHQKTTNYDHMHPEVRYHHIMQDVWRRIESVPARPSERQFLRAFRE